MAQTREQRQAYKRVWYARNRETHLENCRAYRTARPAQYQQYARVKKYGLTNEQVDAMIEAQEGRCAICCQIPKKWFIDHCHETGRVRAALCPGCNTAIGLLGDNPTLLVSALEYLREHAKEAICAAAA